MDVDVFVCAGAGANAKGVDLVKDRKSFAESKLKERIVYSANFGIQTYELHHFTMYIDVGLACASKPEYTEPARLMRAEWKCACRSQRCDSQRTRQ